MTTTIDAPDGLLHITEQAAWVAAQANGIYRAPSLEREGFIHLSRYDQVAETAGRFYAGQTGLVLLVIDPARLVSPVRHDTVPGHGTFPHLYGPLNLDAVVTVLPLKPFADAGDFRFPPELETDA